MAKQYYKRHNIVLMHIPPRSPDLNPIERFWAWVRQQLRHKDLDDLKKGRPALGKAAYRLRVRQLLRTKAAQQVAKSKFLVHKKICQEIINKKGAASRA